MRTTQLPALAISVAVLALGAAGCGDDADGRAGESGEVGARGAFGAYNQARPAEPEPVPSAAAAEVLWPAPPDPLDRTHAAGLRPERKEFLVHHAHAHLDVFVDGRAIVVPAGIGIEIDDPEVRRFEDSDGEVGYGGITRCRTPCISPLHTHDATGIVHTESKSPEPNTLGQFFTEWGVSLGDTCLGEHCSRDGIAVYVNGEPYRQDPRAIELTDGLAIAIVVGTPPAQIPRTAVLSES